MPEQQWFLFTYLLKQGTRPDDWKRTVKIVATSDEVAVGLIPDPVPGMIVETISTELLTAVEVIA